MLRPKLVFTTQESKTTKFERKNRLFFSEGMDLSNHRCNFWLQKLIIASEIKISGKGYLGELESLRLWIFQWNKNTHSKGKTRIILNEESFRRKNNEKRFTSIATSFFMLEISPALAQQISLTADEQVELHQNEQKLVAIGNAEAQKGDTKINAEKMTANYTRF